MSCIKSVGNEGHVLSNWYTFVPGGVEEVIRIRGAPGFLFHVCWSFMASILTGNVSSWKEVKDPHHLDDSLKLWSII